MLRMPKDKISEANYENQFGGIKSPCYDSNLSNHDIKMTYYHDVMGKFCRGHLNITLKACNLNLSTSNDNFLF